MRTDNRQLEHRWRGRECRSSAVSLIDAFNFASHGDNVVTLIRHVVTLARHGVTASGVSSSVSPGP